MIKNIKIIINNRKKYKYILKKQKKEIDEYKIKLFIEKCW
jgi:hypothetical protein